MKRIRQPQLDGCKPLLLKYKEVPVENGAGDRLTLCQKCQGSGELCTAEKASINKLGVRVIENLPEFAGTFRRQRERSGYTVTAVGCTACRGVGLSPKGGPKS